MTQVLQGEIVIIDDKPQELENLRKLLTLEGFDTLLISEHGELFKSNGAAEKFLDGGYHQRIFLISLDHAEEDPLSTFDRLTQNFPEARFGFISDSFDMEKVDDYFAAGIDAFFTKPISAEKFLTWAADTTSLAVDIGKTFAAST